MAELNISTELGNSDTDKLSILNKVIQFIGNKLRFEPKMCDSMLITKLLLWMQCYAISLCSFASVSRSTTLVPGFFPH